MGKIVLLDEATINKIAAGEVIERPASVVKEVVENSIDAGANNITIEIKNGGISYIRVTDNGKGIMQDDMEIAFERHATSKLRNADELSEIKSMGFRGEALASIAAIAKVELLSKTKESGHGYKVVIEGGKILEKEEAGCADGTSITIENLFFNTPVRYKFLKKDFTESGYIEDTVARIALVHPEIAIKLINTGKTIIQTSGDGNIQSVIYNIYGKDIAENIINIDYQYEDIKIKGVIGKPVISRSNRTNQLFFVNQRYIKDKTLSSAADQAFKGFITIGKHGFLVLNIDMDPKKVDVNVHPAKLEVRFQDENNIFKAVYHAIRDGLSKEDLIATTSTIEGIDKGQRNIDAENGENKQTLFQDITKAFEYNKENSVEPEKEEPVQITDGDFDDVVNRLLKIQNVVNLAKGEKEVTAEEIKEKLNDYRAEQEDTSNIIEEKNNKIDENAIVEENEINLSENIMAEEKEDKLKENAMTKANEDKIDENAIVEENEVNLSENIMAEENKVKLKENVITEENEVKAEADTIEEKDDELKTENKKGTISDEEFQKLYQKMFGVSTYIKQEKNKDEYDASDELKPIDKKSNISVFEETEEYKNQLPYQFIGIAFKTYIIIQIENELYLIDQHAAHERIMYEKVKKNYYNTAKKDSQLMLWPDVITLTHKEMGIFRDNRKIFEQAGFIVEEFGENTVKLSGVPTILLDLETKEIFLETLDEINTVARTAKQEIEERFIATVACKAAVKAHMALEKQEVENLMNELLKLPNPFTCPHGRPTAIKMTKNDIEKKFSRIQN